MILTDFPWVFIVSGFICALLVSALGFCRTTWFISIGYGFSVMALSILFACLSPAPFSVTMIAQLTLLFAYGLRLSAFLIARERAASYIKQAQAAAQARSKGITISGKLGIWLSVAALYTAMTLPAVMNLTVPAAHQNPSWQIAGVVIMLLGLVLEMLADWQKSAAKKRQPTCFVSSGLYSIVRCPNYLGEMTFWTGNILCAVPLFFHVFSALLAFIGWGCIELIMVGAARRLELKQTQRYGEQEDFQRYSKRVPILFPLIPLYTLKNWKIRLG